MCESVGKEKKCGGESPYVYMCIRVYLHMCMCKYVYCKSIAQYIHIHVWQHTIEIHGIIQHHNATNAYKNFSTHNTKGQNKIVADDIVKYIFDSPAHFSFVPWWCVYRNSCLYLLHYGVVLYHVSQLYVSSMHINIVYLNIKAFTVHVSTYTHVHARHIQ